MLEQIRLAATLISFSRRTAALTGAGVSTESGIPDFRSPKSLLWERIHAYQFMPIEAYTDGDFHYIDIFYRYWFPLLFPMIQSEPNVTHHFLARLEEAGLLSGIMTQNTDGLHQKAGSGTVHEIHGNLAGGHCWQCDKKYTIDFILEQIDKPAIPPACTECGGIVGPDIVFAFERTPAYDESLVLAENVDLLLALGSSLLVEHVKEIVNKTLEAGGRLIVINAQPTPFDDVADVVIHERLSTISSLIWEQLGDYY